MHCVGCDSIMIEGQQEYECDFCEYTGCSSCLQSVVAPGRTIPNAMACKSCIDGGDLEVIADS